MDKVQFVVGQKYIRTEEGGSPWTAKGLILIAERDDGSTHPVFTLPDGILDNHNDNWVHCGVDKVEPYNEPVVVKRVPATSIRQFDSTFKLSIVRQVLAIRKHNKTNKTRGGITVLLDSWGITWQHVTYWMKQHDQGHFTTNRAVAFSRKDTMIHG